MAYKVFVDTNVILEHILRREKWAEANELFKLAEDGVIQCFLSSSSYYTLAYVLRKYLSDKQKRIILGKYLSLTSVLTTDANHLTQGLISSFKDIEDAFQYYTALGKVDYFLTFNKKDFARYSLAQLEVYTPGEFLKEFAV